MTIQQDTDLPGCVILLAHGSKQEAWARPFEQVLNRVRRSRPRVTVTLAFLEFMTPLLPDALDAAAANGCKRVSLVPLFLGTGAHLQRDVQAAVEAAKRRHPHIQVALAPPAGDDPSVIAALVGYALRRGDA